MPHSAIPKPWHRQEQLWVSVLPATASPGAAMAQLLSHTQCLFPSQPLPGASRTAELLQGPFPGSAEDGARGPHTSHDISHTLALLAQPF